MSDRISPFVIPSFISVNCSGLSETRFGEHPSTFAANRFCTLSSIVSRVHRFFIILLFLFSFCQDFFLFFLLLIFLFFYRFLFCFCFLCFFFFLFSFFLSRLCFNFLLSFACFFSLRHFFFNLLQIYCRIFDILNLCLFLYCFFYHFYSTFFPSTCFDNCNLFCSIKCFNLFKIFNNDRK